MLPVARCIAVALTGQPAGTVATRVAGLVNFRAVLEWDAVGGSPASCLPAPGDFYRQDLTEMLSPCGTRLEVRGGIRALTERGLAGAVERVMRRVSDAAAVSGAVLEMRVIRGTPPRGLQPDLVQALATDLWRAGFPVRLAPCWDAVGPEGLALGARGEDEGLREFLRDHSVWNPS
jgi:hypothetical protein